MKINKNKKLQIGSVILLISICIGVFLFLQEDDEDGFTSLNQINQIYQALQENNDNELSKITKFPPSLEYTYVYSSTEESKSSVINGTIPPEITNENIQSYLQWQSDFESEYNQTALNLSQKQNAYFQYLSSSSIIQDQKGNLEEFYKYNSENDVLYHDIYQFFGEMSQSDVENLLNTNFVLGIAQYKISDSWSNLDNLTIFEVESEIIGAIYTLESNLVLDIYTFEDNNITSIPLSSYFEVEEDLDDQIRSLRQEVITDGKGIYY